ncbi:MAG: hypothetical protein M3Y49_07260 [Actinomycetota bacterium]|nr:hypothetical protein [Actinomycetota bacterium]
MASASKSSSVLSPRDRARAAKARQEQERKARDRRVEALVTDWYAGVDRRAALQAQVDANEASLAAAVAGLCDTEGEPVAGAAALLDVSAGQVQALRTRHKKLITEARPEGVGEGGSPGGVALVPAAEDSTGSGKDTQGRADDGAVA